MYIEYAIENSVEINHIGYTKLIKPVFYKVEQMQNQIKSFYDSSV
ncbi:hypothetical protein BTJ48_00212 [Bacillus mycoides]|nr:hypothetical protein BTJ48_00212 [Bacillus mycoides]